MFDFSAMATATSPKDALERANFAVRNKLGKFMSSGSRVIELRDKTTNANLVERGNALLSEIAAIESKALNVLGEAKTLQEKMAAGLNLADVKSGASVAKELLEINAAMDAHMGRVDAFAWEVQGFPKALAKTGFLAGVDRRLLIVGGLAAVVVAYYLYKDNRRGKK